MCKVMLMISLRGKDKEADGMLEIELPYPPFRGLHLCHLNTHHDLVIVSIGVSVPSRSTAVKCDQIRNDNKKLMSLVRQFVGEWQWEFRDIEPDEEELVEEPPPSLEKPEPNYHDIAELLLSRGRSVPSQAEQKDGGKAAEK